MHGVWEEGTLMDFWDYRDFLDYRDYEDRPDFLDSMSAEELLELRDALLNSPWCPKDLKVTSEPVSPDQIEAL